MHYGSSCKQQHQLAACMMKAMNCGHHDEDGGLNWLEDSISFLAGDVDIAGWWSSFGTPAAQQDDIGSVVAQTLSPPAAAPPSIIGSPPLAVSPSIASPQQAVSSEPASSSKKRKYGGGQSQQRRRAEKKGGGSGSSCDREMRWAEQLLNPCASAIEAGNLSRVQHLFYVLGELASFSGDPNHRLAAHGLRALALRVGPSSSSFWVPPCISEWPPSFARADPRAFRAAMIRFHEVSPWFALPNALANAAIIHQHHHQAPQQRRRRSSSLHVVDLGVSHGVQWPTLLESLTRLPGTGGTRPSVRLTTVAAAAGSLSFTAPFASAPPGYDFSPHLLRYAKSIDLQLHIARADSIDSVVIPSRSLQLQGGDDDESTLLVVCLQFRLGHASTEDRTNILTKVRGLNPDLVILSELDFAAAAATTTTGQYGGGGMSGEFAARLEMLWRFLESTAAAFKGRDGDERRLMEAEAGTSYLAADAGPGEGRDAWRERMAAAGFQEAAFGDDAVESAKSLLRKYDGGWEMALSPPPAASSSAGKAVALRWKGQPVSFCSLWRPTACTINHGPL
ncbi:hypothetical protein QOZ80_3BG0276230 [Eleusine coracana subsp. coracana]|nr:hypothetical protein QOZ80_3BG0276230 [Eleusine coracana subsp. coracana]